MAGREPPVLHANKWITFAACATLQFSAGLCYSFGLFSSDMKQAFRWSQGRLDGFGTALNLGAFAAFIPGALYNALASNPSGPRICLTLAALECMLGMGLVWAAVTGHVQLSYPALLLAGFIFTNSNATIDIVSVSTNLANWPNDRGSAVGVMKAAVGLSASVYGVLHGALRLGTSALLLLMMLAPALSCLLLLPLVSSVPWIQRSELMPHGLLTTSARFYLAYQVLFLIALFTALASAVLRDAPPPALRAAVAPILAALCASTFLVAIFSGGLRSRPAHAHLQPALHDEPLATRRPPDTIVSHPAAPDGLFATLRREMGGRRSGEPPPRPEHVAQRTYEVDTFPSADLDGADAAARPPLHRCSGDSAASGALSARSSTSMASELYHEQPAGDVPPARAVRSPEFQLLVFCCFVTMGAALGLLDNLDQVIGSLAPRDAGKSEAAVRVAERDRAELGQALLICFSVSNLAGRVAAGYLSERALHAWGVARTFSCIVVAIATLLWLSFLAAAIVLAHTPLALPLLLPVTIMAGATFGASWTLMSVTTSEFFGLTHFATNYAAVQMAPMLATCLCPVLFGRLYDHVARKQHPDATNDDIACSGASCFLPATAIMCLLSVLQVFAALALYLRTKWIYEREAAHLREVHDIVEEGSSVGVSENSHLLRAVAAAARARVTRETDR